MRIYLSSTLNDLLPERQAVKDVLTRKCAVVESYLADERNVRDSCEADVASCAYYIGIFGLRYGSKAPGQNQSITQIEYAAAVRARIPTLLFVKDERYILAAHADAFTRENPPELIESFRALITSGAAGVSRCAVFTTPEDLKVQVLHAMDSPPKPVADKDQERLTDNQPCRIIGSPYPGLRAFRENEADRFFGRDDEVDRLLDKLLVQEQRFIALIGASGSGKSSLIYAGLIPKLANWRSVTVIPGSWVIRSCRLPLR